MQNTATKMVKVRCMKPIWWGPTPRLHKRYDVGEELIVPEEKYLASQWNKPQEVGGMTFRGALVLADEPVASVPDKVTEDINFLLKQNEELKRQLAAVQPKSAAPEPLVVPDPSGGKDDI